MASSARKEASPLKPDLARGAGGGERRRERSGSGRGEMEKEVRDLKADSNQVQRMELCLGRGMYLMTAG